MATIEEKAKAYDEAIKKAKSVIEQNPLMEYLKKGIEYIFPELKESEDERIIRDMIETIKKESKDFPSSVIAEKSHTWLAWLEKQGEKIIPLEEIILNVWELGNYWKELTKGVCNTEYGRQLDYIVKHWKEGEHYIKHFEKQCEQKSDDNVEPKFHEGDWVVVDDGRIGRIIECTKDFADVDLEYSRLSTRVNNIRSWTIQDAKDGDVLSYNDGHGNNCIELIKSITDKKIEFWFCLSNGNYYEVFDGLIPYTNLVSREDATPATKEQRVLLFQKMKEEGYEWDAEKKELKKVEQKPAWSEEDENRINRLIAYFEDKESFTAEDDIVYANWLKSLRPQKQWKPSEEQMATLEYYMHTLLATEHKEVLFGLYNDLKQL